MDTMSTTDCAIARVKSYIAEDCEKVPYLYSNLASLESGDKNIRLWIETDRDDNITAVFLLYHTCLHFFSHQEKYAGEKLQQILARHRVDVMMIPDSQSHMLEYFPASHWRHVTDYIVRHGRKKTYPDYASCLVTSEDEIHDIAALLMEDPLYSESYAEDALDCQLSERWHQGYGKIFRWRENNRTAGCLAVTGENDRFLFYGCLMVAPEFRRKGIAANLVRACVSYACDLNKDCLCFIGIDNIASLAMHKRCDNPVVVGKIIKCIHKNN